MKKFLTICISLTIVVFPLIGANAEFDTEEEVDIFAQAAAFAQAAVQAAAQTTAQTTTEPKSAPTPVASTTAPAAAFTNEDIDAIWAEYIQNATRITTAPRMQGADPQAGEGVLEAFGMRYMPNAYDFYQETRDKALEKEQTLKENFPNGRPSDEAEAVVYDKVAKAVAKSVAEYFRRRDELCHFYLRHKAGILSDAELSDLDSTKICILLPLEVAELMRDNGDVQKPTDAERTFAEKYLPETLVAYDRLSNLLADGEKQFYALRADAVKLDAVRGDLTLDTLSRRLQTIRPHLNELAKTMKDDKLLHAVEEKTSEQLATEDAEQGRKFQVIEKNLVLQTSVEFIEEDTWNESVWGRIVSKMAPVNELDKAMVPIPGEDYAMCKYEVSQALWQSFMGENPSEFKGMDRPVENVSWNDCQEFLRRLNALPTVRESGAEYRLPTSEEWEYACRAGSTGDYCRLADGTEITEDTLDEVAWYYRNSEGETHPVGRKKPNAFGLYDMHGNVWEWTSSGSGSSRVRRGGGWLDLAGRCAASSRDGNSLGHRNDYLGFRLARTLAR